MARKALPSKPMSTPQPIADKLRDLIAKSGRSLRDVSKEADVTYSALHRFMGGGGISLETADALAKAMGKKLSLI